MEPNDNQHSKMPQDFDVDPKTDRVVRLPRWQYPLLQSYNGFSGIERVQGWQLTRWAINVGVLREPRICSISGRAAGDQPFHYHNENYYDPLGPHPIDPRLHRLLHGRFADPKSWHDVVERYLDRAPDNWFARLPDTEPDMAAELRSQGVFGGKEMVDRFMKALPVGSPKPIGKLMTLDDFDNEGKLIKRKSGGEPSWKLKRQSTTTQK